MINLFLAELNAKFPSQPVTNESFMVIEGKKYFKVATTRDGVTPMSAYAFIDKSTGDLFKPASWNAPAKHARGNIKDESGLAACGRYGVAYLR